MAKVCRLFEEGVKDAIDIIVFGGGARGREKERSGRLKETRKKESD